MRLVRSAAAIALVVGLIACQDPSAPSRVTETTKLTVSIPVPTKDKAVVDAAIEVLSTRLRTLGVGNFSSSAGTDLTFTIFVDGTVDEAAINAALHAPGVVSFLGWPAGDPPPAGGPGPAGLPPLFDAASQIVSATTLETADAPVVEVTLGPQGTNALSTYTSAHIGGHLVIVLDDKVLASPLVMNGILDGRVDISLPGSLPIRPEAVAAIMASGPLPAGWIAP